MSERTERVKCDDRHCDWCRLFGAPCCGCGKDLPQGILVWTLNESTGTGLLKRFLSRLDGTVKSYAITLGVGFLFGLALSIPAAVALVIPLS